MLLIFIPSAERMNFNRLLIQNYWDISSIPDRLHLLVPLLKWGHMLFTDTLTYDPVQLKQVEPTPSALQAAPDPKNEAGPA
jgi:hypothetical protein|tara:strand:+ start:730 stop:972 length:243 start_codon:yes stop_codon:yes gene_type:complete